MNAACAVCHTTTEPLTASGLCGTCQSQASETKAAPPDAFAPTATGEPALDTLSAATTDTSDSLLPPGGYELIEEIGVGGMGLVWKARRLSTGQFVAIKKLQPKCFTPTGFKRFVAEARAIESVDHLNIVRLLDFVPDPADPFLVLEYVPGKNLVDLLKESGPFHPDRAARVLVDICHGVQAAHDKGIVHRDLKPNNVLLAPNGRVKVTDFGLTKSVAEAGVLVAAGGGADDSPEHADTLTRTGHTAGGTPGYLAPEQADATFAPIDRRADVWGAGATLFTLIVGRPPFAGGKENMRRVLTDPLVPPHEIDPRVPRDLSEIVVRCLQKQPADRYPTVAAVADDLTKFLNRDSTAANPQPWVQRQWRRARGMNRWTVVGWALAAAVVVVGISLAMVPKGKADPHAFAQRQLNSGKEVAVVENGRLQLPTAWQLGDAVLVEPTADEPFTSFASRDVALLTVMPDPGVERYRISARIHQMPVTPLIQAAISTGEPSVGIFWAYRETSFPDGTKARAFMALRFSDVQPKPEKVRKTYLSLWDLGQVETPLALPIPDKKMRDNCPLELVPQLPGPTRELTVDVAPDQLVLHLPNGSKAITATQLAENTAGLEKALSGVANGQALGTQDWSPRSPLGLYVDRSRVAVERFTITPSAK